MRKIPIDVKLDVKKLIDEANIEFEDYSKGEIVIALGSLLVVSTKHKKKRFLRLVKKAEKRYPELKELYNDVRIKEK